MNLLAFLLLPIVLTMGRHVSIKNINLKIDNNILTQVLVTGKSPNNLDLSNQGLEAIEEGAFAHLSSLKTLNLSNNSIRSLPNLLFSKLQNLEELNLANNLLEQGQFFAGLSNLRTVNISNNPLTKAGSGVFYGIPKSAKIFTRGINLRTIEPSMFERAPDHELSILRSSPIRIMSLEYRERFEKLRFEVCIERGHLKSLKESKPHEIPAEGCFEVPIKSNVVSLKDRGIKTFQKGWYRLHEPAITALILENNGIVSITKELLNDLPEEIVTVSLRGNKIKRLDAGVMKRASPLEKLDLSGNLISEIEDGALAKLNLTNELLLDWNRLSSTKFVKSLPKISSLGLTYNNIAEIEKGSFKGMYRLYKLNLAVNPLKKLENGALAGLSTGAKCQVSRGSWDIEFIQPGLFDEI